MATDGARRFWKWLDDQQRSRGVPVELRARFSGDQGVSTPVAVVVRDGEPLVRLAPETRAIFEQIDAAKIASQHDDPEEGRLWREAFAAARGEELLSPNAACRLILGPNHRPGRRIFSFNANIELQVNPRDAAQWFDDIDVGDGSWPSLSDLIQRFEDRNGAESPSATDLTRWGTARRAPQPPTGRRGMMGEPLPTREMSAAPGGAGRADANQIALRSVRSILDSAEPFDLAVEGKTIHVSVERLPPEPWPAGGIAGLDPTADGPLPAAVRLDCTWNGGSVRLVMSMRWWQTQGRYRHLIGIRTHVAATKREILWITVALALQTVADGRRASLSASCSLFSRKEAATAEDDLRRNRSLKTAVARSRLPLVSDSRVLAFEAELPSGAVLPSPEEAFRRLIHVSLLKLPFFLQSGEEGIEGLPPFEVSSPPAGIEDAAPQPAPGKQKLAGFYSLPGGVRRYRVTLDEILAWFADSVSSSGDGGDGGRTMEAILAMLSERYEATGLIATRGYLGLLMSLGFVAQRQDESFELTDQARAYLAAPTPEAVFERMNDAYEGILATLALVAELRAARPAATKTVLSTLLEKDWKTANQSSFRANWLLSLGLTERTPRGDVLTDLGREVLDRHPEALDLRQQIASILAENPDLAGIDEPDPIEDDEENVVVGTSPLPLPAAAATEPPSWNADRLDLTAELVRPHLGSLQLPPIAIEQVCAALSAGKHLLLVGPPGTGKTELAAALSQAAATEGYSQGAYMATASADWTTFDTIGGYALKQDGSLAFRSGVFLQAIERWQWLIIDELNRADVDRAFGELMTVLAGRSTDTPFELSNGRNVSIGQETRCSHRLPRTFRVIATMNTWDKTSLFRLSYAVQRRFAIVHVGIPDDTTYAELVDRVGQREGIDPPLDPGAAGPLKDLFRGSGLLGHRAIGPAILIDVVRYMRRRRMSGDGLAEAVAMYLLPQLEGLDQDGAATVFKKLGAALRDWTSHDALATLRERYQEIFPHVKLPEA